MRTALVCTALIGLAVVTLSLPGTIEPAGAQRVLAVPEIEPEPMRAREQVEFVALVGRDLRRARVR